MNIFIAGLSYNLSEAELEELFAEYGEVVSAKVIMDRETGRSKGYGFVEMAEDEAGNKAIEALNGAEVDGKTLSVSVARPKTEGPRRSYNNNGGGGYLGGIRGGGYGNSDHHVGYQRKRRVYRWSNHAGFASLVGSAFQQGFPASAHRSDSSKECYRKKYYRCNGQRYDLWNCFDD